MNDRYDAVIVGGGHNALVSAAYLAGAGHRVVVLERLDTVGGAAVSQRPWPGVDARLSRYSYLVSLLPRQIIDDLGLTVTLRRRRYSSYTPDPADPTRGILIDTADAAATGAGFARATGDGAEAARFARFAARLQPFARAVFPTMTAPLPRADDLRRQLDDDALWEALTVTPLGGLIRSSLASDLARGIALTDGLIGTFASADDASLAQNRCFAYHVIGGGTGDWDVPVGGMGTVSTALKHAARAAGADLRTGVTVTAVAPDGVVTLDAGATVHGRVVLSGVGPAVLAELLRAGGADAGEVTAPEGAQLKVNMLLRRLPRLRDERVAPEAAFAGTFHVNETFSQLDAAYDVAARGRIADPLPAEIYCHSLTDPSILGPELRASGAHTLTLFGLHTPHRLTHGADPDALRADLLAADALARRRAGRAARRLPLRGAGWHRVHRGAHHRRPRTVARHGRRGYLPRRARVAVGRSRYRTRRPGPALGRRDRARPDSGVRIGARRGGAVSGIGGHNAAMAARELLER